MKKSKLFLFVVPLLLTSCNLINKPGNTTSSSTSNNASSLKANFLAINDTHGRLVSDSGNIGLDKVSGLMNYLENRDGDYIKIANGDIFQGTFESNITYGAPLVECFNEMELDCLVIGNHEFDWGIDKIANYKDGDLSNGEAEFDFLSCNIVEKDTLITPDWMEPYLVKTNEFGAKVGVIGAIGEYLTSSINANMVEDYLFLDPVPIIEKTAKKLRIEEDCDFVVVAIHEHYDSTINSIANLTGNSKIDGIFTAHTHSRVDETVKGIPVLQGACNNEYVAVMNFAKSKSEVTFKKSLLSVEDSNKMDYDVKSIITEYMNGEVAEKGNEVIGYSYSYKSRNEMAYELTKAMNKTFGGDIAITNNARESLNAGDITYKEIYEVFPFDNMIIKASISGLLLKEFLNNSSSVYYYAPELNISTLENNEMYEMYIIDYLYDNSRNSDYFSQDPNVRIEQNIYMRDVFIDYLKEVKTI